MKRLLIAAGDKLLSPATIDFGCYLAKLSKSELTGVFLQTPEHEEAPVSRMRLATYTAVSPKAVSGRYDHQVKTFQEACASRNVTGRVKTEKLMAWDEFLAETRFADALIMDSDFTIHAQALEAYPSHHAKKLLHEAECPIVIAPLSFERVDEIILTYDGTKSSAFAIRQFIQLFPELRDMKTTILEVWSEEDETHRSDQASLSEWLGNHFSNVDYVLLQGDVQSRLLEFLLARPYSFVVMGGFGRSRTSRIFQPSATGTVVKMVSSPVFVAHT